MPSLQKSISKKEKTMKRTVEIHYDDINDAEEYTGLRGLPPQPSFAHFESFASAAAQLGKTHPAFSNAIRQKYKVANGFVVCGSQSSRK